MSPLAVTLPAPAAAPVAAPSRGVSEAALVAALEDAARAHMALAVRMLGAEEDARDALQEAWFRAWRGRAAMREDAALHGWLRRIVARECLRLLRRRAVRAWLPFAEGAHEPPCWLPGPEAMAAEREMVLRVRRAVDALPPRQRVVWGLRFDEGWAVGEIAATLDLSTETVKTHLARAVATVQGRLEASHAV